MDTGDQPLHQRDGVHFIKPLQHILAGFKNFDPAVEKKLACHPSLPHEACKFGLRKKASPQEQATGDLVIIAFYYLLRVGEYTTKRRRGNRTRTRQFRVKDVMFFKHDKHGVLKALPLNASIEDIMTGDAAMLQISNQKNGHAGACVHHETLNGHGDICPVRALGRRVIHIRSNTKSGNVFLSSYWDTVMAMSAS